jgi:hypothetical protein
MRMAGDADGLPGLNNSILEPMVRDLLGESRAVVSAGWFCQPLNGAGEGLGTYRVTGSARVGDASHPWALVCKVRAATDGADPEAWDYPAREELAYGSELLAAHPGGLTTPRCLAVEEQPDGTTRLWLEAVTDVHPGPWPRERYASVARDLGRFNGAYLHGTPLPDHPWLSRKWLREFVTPCGLIARELADRAGPDGPLLLQRLYPPPAVREITRLWTERELFLTALDRLPQTLCHQDAHRRNLLLRAGPAGEELVAIDWAYAGHGAVGEDLEQLVMGSLFFGEVEGSTPEEHDAVCFAGYMAGMREAGWAGDKRLVRLGYTAAMSLRHTVGLLRYMAPDFADPANYPAWEGFFGRPIDTLVEDWAELWSFQFARADEARALLPLAG